MKRIVLILGITLLASSWAGAIMVKVEVPQLVADASNIVTGKVLSVTSCYTPDHKSIYTNVVIMVTSELTGSVNGPEITIRQNGGVMPDLGLAIEDSAEFSPGEDVILFMAKNSDGTYNMADMHQSKYTVANDTVVENGKPVSAFLAEINSAIMGGK